jgi:hypothetical protein
MSAQTAGEKFRLLVDLMERLRARRLSLGPRADLRHHQAVLLEETYEVMDAIDARAWPTGRANWAIYCFSRSSFPRWPRKKISFDRRRPDAIIGKLIRRHPHVFADETAKTEGAYVSGGTKSRPRRN